MRILLIGDYSGLHSALKHGLLQHSYVVEVKIVGDGDKFKNFAVDYSIRPKWTMTKFGTFFRKGIHKLFGWDIAELEKGYRMQKIVAELKNFDVIQFVNDRPIQTLPFWEKRLVKQLVRQNGKSFLLSCGIDVLGLQYLMQHKEEKSLLTPYFENTDLKPLYDYVFEYQKKTIVDLHQLIVKHCCGIIASDWDYVLPNLHHPKYKGLIPHPVIIQPEEFPKMDRFSEKISVFLGINRGNYYQKGIHYFEQALGRKQQLYPEKVEINIVEQLSYKEYQKLQQKATIVLDQVFSNDQGYNALEAMARGQVVFTGASAEFLAYFNLQPNEVCIEAKPDINYLVEQLSFLINNPMIIKQIGVQAKAFVKQNHQAEKIAQQYLSIWNKL